MIHRTTVAVALVVAGVGWMGAARTALAQDDVSIAEMFAALQGSLERVDTIQYEADLLMTDYIAELGIKPGLTHHRLEFAMSDDRFYTSAKTVQTMFPPGIRWQAAFDGREYQRFDERRLIVKASPPAREIARHHTTELLTVPFTFAFQDGDIVEHPTLLKGETWTRLAGQAQHAGTETIDGVECDKVVISQSKQGATFDYVVYFDRELDYYPRKETCNIEVIDRADDAIDKRMPIETTTVPVVHEIDGQRVIVPASVKSDMYDVRGRLFRTIEIKVDPETLKINQPIPDERFRLELP